MPILRRLTLASVAAITLAAAGAVTVTPAYAANPFERGPAPTVASIEADPRLVRHRPDHRRPQQRLRLRRRHHLLPDQHRGRHVRRRRHLARLHRVAVQRRLARPAAGLAGLRRDHHRHPVHAGPAGQPRAAVAGRAELPGQHQRGAHQDRRHPARRDGPLDGRRRQPGGGQYPADAAGRHPADAVAQHQELVVGAGADHGHRRRERHGRAGRVALRAVLHQPAGQPGQGVPGAEQRLATRRPPRRT